MAYLEGYKHDIFISYSHIDNLTLSEEEIGWIENFLDRLNLGLWQLIGTRDFTIWWDKRLDGNTLFNDSITDALKSSAILVCLNSPSYLNSEYCKKERDLFYKFKEGSEGIKTGDRSRILNVLLYNIPHQKWPPEFGGASGFHFHDADKKNDRGHPLDINTPQFSKKMQSLCDSLFELIEMIEPPPDPSLFDIYFGDVSDSLRNLRKRTITELKKQGIEIIPDVPPPYEKDEHEKIVKKKLNQAELSVHLLDQFPGRNIDGDDTQSYPQKQAELSLQLEKPKLIWVPAELDIKTIEEEKYKNFIHELENDNSSLGGLRYVRSPKSELSQQVIDMANEQQHRWTGVRNGKGSALIDTHSNDELYALKLNKILLEYNAQSFINPQEGDPKKNISILEDRIRRVNSLIFFYGNVSCDWIKERVNAARQFIVLNKNPINELFILMLPPHKDPDSLIFEQTSIKITVMNNSNTPELDLNVLQPFLENIMVVA